MHEIAMDKANRTHARNGQNLYAKNYKILTREIKSGFKAPLSGEVSKKKEKCFLISPWISWVRNFEKKSLEICILSCFASDSPEFKSAFKFKCCTSLN